MSTFIYLITYLAIIVFVAMVVKKIVHYVNNPLHVRWELYPVPHEGGGRAEYGGSYLEDVDWWDKPRKVSKIGELKVMIPEMLFLKAVWEHNRALWWVTFPFHLGLYFTMAFIGLLIAGAMAQLAGVPVDSSSGPVISAIAALTNLLGPAGFILTIVGALGLVYKRLNDEGLKNYTNFEHFFNLCLFITTMGLAVTTWLLVDSNFSIARTFLANLMTLQVSSEISSGLFMLQVLLGVLTMAYIPMTHMSHFFMKYFLYHDIRWGDEPNINTPKTDEQIGVVLNYPVSWSAPHIAGHGKETWAEVATFNPVAEPEKEKE